MNDKTTLQNHLESFKSQMKEVNESLYKFESEFEKEKAKIEKLRHSFFVVVKLFLSKEFISSELINFTVTKNECLNCSILAFSFSNSQFKFIDRFIYFYS